jgi:hypothetical protein
MRVQVLAISCTGRSNMITPAHLQHHRHEPRSEALAQLAPLQRYDDKRTTHGLSFTVWQFCIVGFLYVLYIVFEPGAVFDLSCPKPLTTCDTECHSL